MHPNTLERNTKNLLRVKLPKKINNIGRRAAIKQSVEGTIANKTKLLCWLSVIIIVTLRNQIDTS